MTRLVRLDDVLRAFGAWERGRGVTSGDDFKRRVRALPRDEVASAAMELAEAYECRENYREWLEYVAAFHPMDYRHAYSLYVMACGWVLDALARYRSARKEPTDTNPPGTSPGDNQQEGTSP